jgi:hypothetical protein
LPKKLTPPKDCITGADFYNAAAKFYKGTEVQRRAQAEAARAS